MNILAVAFGFEQEGYDDVSEGSNREVCVLRTAGLPGRELTFNLDLSSDSNPNTLDGKHIHIGRSVVAPWAISQGVHMNYVKLVKSIVRLITLRACSYALDTPFFSWD